MKGARRPFEIVDIFKWNHFYVFSEINKLKKNYLVNESRAFPKEFQHAMNKFNEFET